MQVTTPIGPEPEARSTRDPKNGNTLGCRKGQYVLVSQHFFALKLKQGRRGQSLTALQNASVVTDTHNPQIVKNGGPTDITVLVARLGVKSTGTAFHPRHSFDWRAVDFKAFRAPCATVANGVFGARWRLTKSCNLVGEPQIPSTTSSTTIDCWTRRSHPWRSRNCNLRAVSGQDIWLKGLADADGNHAKIGVSTSGSSSLHNFWGHESAGRDHRKLQK